jgi:hypothetical protein
MIGGVSQSDTAARFQSEAVRGGVINHRHIVLPRCPKLVMVESIHRQRSLATISATDFVHAAWGPRFSTR